MYECLRDTYISLSEVICCTLAFISTICFLPIMLIPLAITSIKAFYYYILFRTGNLSEDFLDKLKRADSRYEYVDYDRAGRYSIGDSYKVCTLCGKRWHKHFRTVEEWVEDGNL